MDNYYVQVEDQQNENPVRRIHQSSLALPAIRVISNIIKHFISITALIIRNAFNCVLAILFNKLNLKWK